MRSSNSPTPPYNFSWIIPNQIAGMSAPRLKTNLQFIVNAGIKYLITLSSDHGPNNDVKDFPQLEWTIIDIEEFEAPSIDDIQKFIDICQKCRREGKAVGVHCRKGLGRTGVMLACYLMAFQDVTPERAMSTIRAKRPWSIETYEQERALFHYHDFLRSQD